jgi:hypothetical protein
MSPEEIAEWIRNHYKENPKHGVGCSCLDAMIRQVRLLTAPLNPALWDRREADEQEHKVLSACFHVLYFGTQRRDW